MKKSYLMIAAAAGLMLTACTSEDDYAAQNAAVEQGDGAVLFDTYLSNNTRAGQEGIMTTTTLQSTGFGIVAYQHLLTAGNYTPSAKPNFMWNQYVGYEASNWVYSPLKYWPNETTKDQQTTNATSSDNECVSFYAYAPYVVQATGTEDASGKDWDKFQLMGSASEAAGIISMTTNAATTDPKIHYVVATGNAANKYPSNSVDLLWGVSSGFAYHPVNLKDREGADLGAGVQTVIMPEGLPVEKMQKPSLDEKIKFNFNHALARIGLTVVGAFDQKAQGGVLDDRTRVTISEITVTGNAFATEGILNLDNTKENRAKWESLVTDNNIDTDYDNSKTPDAVGVIVTNNANDEMNPELRADPNYATKFPNVAGVKATEQYVLTENSYTKVSKPVFDEKKTYFENDNGGLIDLQPTSGDAPVAWTAEDGYLWYSYDSKTSVYTKSGGGSTAPAWNLYSPIELVTVKGTIFAAKDATKPADVAGNVYATKDASDNYTIVAYSNIPATLTEDIYTIDVKAPVAKYTGDVYELTTKPRYFMIIPTTGNNPEDKVVTVTIKYYVTTRDAKLPNKISLTENFIKQNVTLKEFTNGKAYNLKLILGLTSVKVDAEVSNWEVGTVESNLPQNLE